MKEISYMMVFIEVSSIRKEYDQVYIEIEGDKPSYEFMKCIFYKLIDFAKEAGCRVYIPDFGAVDQVGRKLIISTYLRGSERQLQDIANRMVEFGLPVRISK